MDNVGALVARVCRRICAYYELRPGVVRRCAWFWLLKNSTKRLSAAEAPVCHRMVRRVTRRPRLTKQFNAHGALPTQHEHWDEHRMALIRASIPRIVAASLLPSYRRHASTRVTCLACLRRRLPAASPFGTSPRGMVRGAGLAEHDGTGSTCPA